MNSVMALQAEERNQVVHGLTNQPKSAEPK